LSKHNLKAKVEMEHGNEVLNRYFLNNYLDLWRILD